MKIAGLRLFRVEGQWSPQDWEERAVRPLDLYPEHAGARADAWITSPHVSHIYLEVLTEEGASGQYGPVDARQAFLAATELRGLLAGAARSGSRSRCRRSGSPRSGGSRLPRRCAWPPASTRTPAGRSRNCSTAAPSASCRRTRTGRAGSPSNGTSARCVQRMTFRWWRTATPSRRRCTSPPPSLSRRYRWSSISSGFKSGPSTSSARSTAPRAGNWHCRTAPDSASTSIPARSRSGENSDLAREDHARGAAGRAALRSPAQRRIHRLVWYRCHIRVGSAAGRRIQVRGAGVARAAAPRTSTEMQMARRVAPRRRSHGKSPDADLHGTRRGPRPMTAKTCGGRRD